VRPRGHGSVHQRADGSWCGQIDLGTIDGVRRRRTIYGKTKRAVEKELATLRRQLDEAGDLSTADWTVEKWLTHWLTNIAVKEVRPNTLRSYKTAVNKWLIPSPIGKRKLGPGKGTLRAEDVRRMHAYITDDLELSGTTAHNAHRVLSVALNAAMHDEKAIRNVASIVKAPPKDASSRDGLTVAEVVKVLRAAVGNERLAARWLAAFLLGWRQGEVLGLQWDRVDLDAGLLDLSWALQRVTYDHGCVKPGQDPTCGRKPRSCPARKVSVPRGMEWRSLHGNLILMRPKTGKARMVACPEPLRLALELRNQAVEAERSNYATDLGLVWCQADGSPIDPRKDWQAWTDLLETSIGRHVTLHEARHTAATLMLELKVDPKVIMEILGHSQMITTQGYQHVSVALQRPALDALAERLAIT
jgi:integrase